MKNSIELSKDLNFTPPPGSILISFDVRLLFPNVPLIPTKERIIEILREASIPRYFIDEFISLLNCCLSPNICQFGNSFFTLPPDIGIPIGSPLGSIISEVFMDKLETEIFQSDHPLLTHIAYWRRYVDDILCVWTGPIDKVKEFLQFINKFYKSIEFTAEIGGPKINFLDLSISISTGKFTFGVYRKPTSTDTLIHGSSFCPFPHKLSAFHYFIHRLVSLPLTPESYANEVSTIKQLAIVNKIDINVDGLIRKKKMKVAFQTTISLTPLRTGKKRPVRIPYLPPLTTNLGKVIKTINRTPIFYSLSTLGRLFPNGKDSTPSLSKSGVYLLRCRDCQAAYVGETGRSFRTRIKEHISAYLNNNYTKSAFAKHLLEENHQPDGPILLHFEDRFRPRLALETIEITKLMADQKFHVLNRGFVNDELISSIFNTSSSPQPV